MELGGDMIGGVLELLMNDRGVIAQPVPVECLGSGDDLLAERLFHERRPDERSAALMLDEQSLVDEVARRPPDGATGDLERRGDLWLARQPGVRWPSA